MDLLPCLEELATGPFPEPDESIYIIKPCLFSILFILSSYLCL